MCVGLLTEMRSPQFHASGLPPENVSTGWCDLIHLLAVTATHICSPSSGWPVVESVALSRSVVLLHLEWYTSLAGSSEGLSRTRVVPRVSWHDATHALSKGTGATVHVVPHCRTNVLAGRLVDGRIPKNPLIVEIPK
mgnify:CR=1 FL=1